MSAVWERLLIQFAGEAIVIMVWQFGIGYATRLSARKRSALFGCTMAIGAMACMSLTHSIMPGMIADLRLPFLVAAGLFCGAPAALIATGATLAFGASQAGDWATAGSLVTLIAGGAGLATHNLLASRPVSRSDILVFSLVIAAAALGSLAASEESRQAFANIGVPFALFNFIGAGLIGLAFLHGNAPRDHTAKAEEDPQWWAEHDLLRASITQAPDFHYVKDVRSRFVAVNEAVAVVNGFERPADMIGKTDFDIDRLPHASELFAAEQEIIRSGRALLNFEETVVDEHGSERWFATSKVPLRGRAGDIIGLAGRTVDITEQKHYAEIKQHFISTVSHELRTPLTAIRGALGLVSSGVAGALTPKAAELIQIAESNSQRLALLIDDMIQTDILDAKRVQFDHAQKPVRPSIEKAIAAAADTAARRDIDVALTDDAPDAQAMIDPSGLTVAVAKLLSNAVKYSPRGGLVAVIIGNHASHVRISIHNDGPRIPEEFRTRIFGQFERADNSDAREMGGTGLGLSIARSLVELMDGKLSYECGADVGTTFHIELPVLSSDRSSETVTTPHAPDAALPSRGQI